MCIKIGIAPAHPSLAVALLYVWILSQKPQKISELRRHCDRNPIHRPIFCHKKIYKSHKYIYAVTEQEQIHQNSVTAIATNSEKTLHL